MSAHGRHQSWRGARAGPSKLSVCRTSSRLVALMIPVFPPHAFPPGSVLRPDLRIIARAEQPSAEIKLRRAGADNVVCSQIIGASRIAHLIARPHVVEFA